MSNLGRPAKYPWEQWTNGDEWTVVEGTDFDCTAESFGVLVRRQARIMGRVVHARRDHNAVTFWFEKEEAKQDGPDARAS